MRKKSIPCYIKNDGIHNVVNVPMGIFARAELRKLVRELLASLSKFETMMFVRAEARTVRLLKGLDAFLQYDLKPKKTRREAADMLAVNEKNLRLSSVQSCEKDIVNLVDFSIKCGLIVILFLIAAHLEFLSN